MQSAPRLQIRATHTAANSPMAIPRTAARFAREFDFMAIHLYYAFSHAKTFKSRRDVAASAAWTAFGHGALCGVVNLPSGILPKEVETYVPVVLLENQAPNTHSLDDLGLDRADSHIHSIRSQPPESAHRSVLAAKIHDRVRLGRVEVWI